METRIPTNPLAPLLSSIAAMSGFLGWLFTQNSVWLSVGSACGSAASGLLLYTLYRLAGKPGSEVSIPRSNRSLLVATVLVMGFVVIWAFTLVVQNSQLRVSNDELAITELMNRETRLVAARDEEIQQCFTANAVIRDVWQYTDPKTNRKSEWEGIAQIHERYRELGRDWSYSSMHDDIVIRMLPDGRAFATATTYLIKPGKDEKWGQKLGEAWIFSRDADGIWRISAFCYAIRPGLEEEVAGELGV